jgi:transcription initiation factor TFIID subunit 13
MDETAKKKAMIDSYRKPFDVTDDKISKSDVKAYEEPLGDADDDMDLETKTVGGRSAGKGVGKR